MTFKSFEFLFKTQTLFFHILMPIKLDAVLFFRLMALG